MTKRRFRHFHEELSTGEAADFLGVERQTIVNWCKIGRLTCRRIDGGRRRIPRSEVAEVFRRNKIPVPPELERAAVAA
jgi:excisionase family DNA binding protein